MQTLTAGSFLNLENEGSVEALKFTARQLAEHTTTIISAENLTAEALKNLANDLWQKAEYVARETERRRLHEIFGENFCERFRELKPEVSRAETASLEVQQNISTVEDDNSTAQQSPATVESVSMPDLPKESATVAEEKKDEFLGFVNSGDSFAVSPATETNAAATTTAMPTAPKDEPVAGEKVSPENPNEIEPQSTAAPAADAKDNPPPSAVKTSATAPKTSDAKEPFEFGKCAVNLSLILLPSSGDEQSRKAIVSATSHNLPPEIEFLEISEGEDLNEIAALVRGKLERFKQTLPAKYIEQLRASKTNRAKKPATSKPEAVSPAPNKPEIAQANGANTNGSQPAQNERATETEKNRTEITATKENLAAQPAPVAPLPQPQVAASNNVQPSLF